MTQKDIHIVFGQSAKGMFVHSKKFDLDKVQLISLEDCLNEGPICDLGSEDQIEKRGGWLSKVLDLPEFKDEYPLRLINRDIETLKSLIQNYNNEKIFLWTGVKASEIIQTARLLYHLKPNCNNVLVFDFNNFSMKNIYGKIVFPKCLGATDLSIVDAVEDNFYQLSEEEMSKYINLWDKVKLENSLLWILGEDEKLVATDEAYFDSFLLSYCTNEYQKPASIVGRTFVDSGLNVGDGYLSYRLKQLVLMGKLQMRGELKSIRDYEVKIP